MRETQSPSPDRQPQSGKGRRRLRLILSLAVLLIVSVVSANTGAWGYAAAKARGLAVFVMKVPLTAVRVCLCSPDEDVRFVREDGLGVAGSLYGVTESQTRPGIILLHGNNPLGRRLSLYKVLATALADRGYTVLTIDLAGFGESDDPFRLGTREVLDAENDVYAAVTYLKTLATTVDTSRIHVIGHSLGASFAVTAGVEDRQLASVSIIGPPTPIPYWIDNPDRVEYFWDRAKRTRQQIFNDTFPSWYTKSRFAEEHLKRDISNYFDYFTSDKHKPLLILNGELEPAHARELLRGYHQRFSEPKGYVTIPHADHYLNVSAFHSINVYDARVMERTADELDRWLSSVTLTR